MKDSLSFRNIFKRETKLASYIVICLTIVVISLSYAMFFQVDSNTNNQEVVAGELTFTYTDGTSITSVGNASCFEPMSSDESGLYLSDCGYRFSVRNTGTLKANYTLKLVANEDNNVDASKIQVMLRKKVGDVYEEVLDYPKILSSISDGILVAEDMDEKTTIEYNIQLYVSENIYVDNDEEVVVSYQIEGSGLVHDDEPIDRSNMMVAMEMEVVDDFFGYEENIVYTQNAKYSEILSEVIYEDEINPYTNAVEVVDFSELKDNSVVGYYVLNEDGKTYTLHIQADGKIKMNPIGSYYFFVGYNNYNGSRDGVVLGTQNLDTSFVTDMSYMFYYANNTELDLSSWNTSNVVNMKKMFMCSELTNLNLSSFDTAKVTDMSRMFFGSNSLTNITYGPKFIYANNASVSSMFSNCPANHPTDPSWNGVTF